MSAAALAQCCNENTEHTTAENAHPQPAMQSSSGGSNMLLSGVCV
jgi:hypothetical protein